MNSLKHIEERLNSLNRQDMVARPPRGWIRFIRKALNMSSKALARRIGISQGSMSEAEKSEENDSISLSKLKRAANALNCDLVYYLLPREPIDRMMEKRAMYLAELMLRNQTKKENIDKSDIERLASELLLNKKLWDD